MVLRTYAVGFFGAVAVLLVGAAVWFAVFQPLDRPGLVWGGIDYPSKQDFKLYLKSKGLSYSTWLNRNPGVAPWEPGTRAATSGPRGQTWDWKRDALLAVNAALLATIAALLSARAISAGERVRRTPAAREGAGRSSPVAAATRTAHALGYVGLGAREVTRVAIGRVRENPESQQNVVWFAYAAAFCLAVGLLLIELLSG